MRKTAVCKDEIWGIWGRKKRHELKRERSYEGKEVMQKTVAEMQGTKREVWVTCGKAEVEKSSRGW